MQFLGYGLIGISVLLFSMQFLFQQQFQNRNGNGVQSLFAFSLYVGLFTSVIMLVILLAQGSKPGFTLWSLLFAALYAADSMLMTFFSLKAFAVTNLSVYSVFSMLGGMALPFVLGVLVYHDALSPMRIVCCVLVVIAVILTARGDAGGKKAIFYYLMVFFFNGMSGVITKVHQTLPDLLPGAAIADSTSFMFLSNALMAVFCLLAMLFFMRKSFRVSLPSLGFSAGYGLFCGVGNLLFIIAMLPAFNVPVAVQSTITTGGVMAISTVISLIRKEHPTVLSLVAAGIAFAASVLMAF